MEIEAARSLWRRWDAHFEERIGSKYSSLTELQMHPIIYSTIPLTYGGGGEFQRIAGEGFAEQGPRHRGRAESAATESLIQ